MKIDIIVKNKIATRKEKSAFIVCGNSDYIINFILDDEWNGYSEKTARFTYNGKTIDVVFNGNECPMPKIFKTSSVKVGLYAGDLHTSTPALIRAQKGALCEEGLPPDPTPDVYAQIMERLSDANLKGDPFTYEDFTEEQLNDLKREPLEIANNAKEIADSSLSIAETANITASRAEEKADGAGEFASAAVEQAVLATEIAQSAERFTKGIDETAAQALKNATTAFELSSEAKDTADKSNELSGQTAERLSTFETETNEKISEVEREHNADKEAIGIAIESEIELREQADSEINARIDTEKSERESSYNSLNEKLDTEKSERENAVNGLQNTLTQESNARKQSDNAINIRIDEETATRTQENTAVNERISQAEQTHETDKKALNTAIEQALSESKKYTDDIAKALLGDGVEEAYNSFKEIQDLMKADDTQTADIIASVSKNTTDIANLGNKKLDEEVYNTFKATEFTPTKTQVETNKSDIAGLKQSKLSQATFDSFQETEFEPLVEQANKNSTDIATVANKANKNAEDIVNLKSGLEQGQIVAAKADYAINAGYANSSGTAYMDANSRNIVDTYETKENATAKATELTNKINEKTAQTDFDALIQAITESLPKVVRNF